MLKDIKQRDALINEQLNQSGTECGSEMVDTISRICRTGMRFTSLFTDNYRVLLVP